MQRRRQQLRPRRTSAGSSRGAMTTCFLSLFIGCGSSESVCAGTRGGVATSLAFSGDGMEAGDGMVRCLGLGMIWR